MSQVSNIPGEVVPNPAEPPRDCPLCPRLVAYRRALLQVKPHLSEVVRNIGRGHELPV